MTGRLLAQLATVAYRDALEIHDRGTLERASPFADRPTLDGADRRREVDRLRVLSARLSHRARVAGFFDDPFGEP